MDGAGEAARAPSRWVHGAAAGLFAGLSLGGLETLCLPLVTDPFAAGVASWALMVVHLLGLVGVLGLAGGLALGALWPSLRDALSPLVGPRQSAELAPDALLTAAANGAALCLVGLVPVAAVLVTGGATRSFNRATLVGPYLALVVGGALAVSFVLFFALRDVARAVLTRVAPSGRLGGLPLPLVLACALAGAGALVPYLLTRGADLAGFRTGPWLFALSGPPLAILLWEKAPRLARPRAVGAALLFTALGLVAALFGLGANRASATVLPFHGFLGQLAVRVLRAGLDFDGDGYAELLGGGDCDDFDPDVNPEQRDVPGNGRDENCDGVDAARVDPADAGRLPRAQRVPARPLSIALIMIDSLRPDHLGLYGYARPTSPHLDAWAKHASVFTRAYAQAPHTPRSLPSLLAGRYPSRVGWVARDEGFSDVTRDTPLLFDAFARAGYRTEAVTAHWYFEQVPNLRRSVALWDNRATTTLRETHEIDVEPDVTARTVARLDALAAAAQPFVLFSHYMGPHSAYLPHPEVASFGPRDLDLYDGEIANVDHYLAQVLARLDQPDLRERTVVVVFSDHGESLGDHGLNLHGRTVFEAEMRVPWLMRVPGMSPAKVNAPVALIDLFPTLAELTGVDPGAVQGRSLVPLLLGDTNWPERLVFLEQIPYPAHRFRMVGAVAADGRKLVRDVTQNVTMGFDLNLDPNELRPVGEAEAARFQPLVEAVGDFLAADPGAR